MVLGMDGRKWCTREAIQHLMPQIDGAGYLLLQHVFKGATGQQLVTD